MSALVSQPVDTSSLNVVIESENIESNDIAYKVQNTGRHSFPISDVSNGTTTIQCYMNQDSTLSFINNSSVFQTVEDDCGEIYYACIGPTNDGINQQDQVLQLIPQNEISNYIISDKDYSSINFITDSSVITSSNYYGNPNNLTSLSKYQQYENNQPNSNVFKSINCIGKQICDICSLEFPSKRTYLKHMSIHENDREFKCSWCKLSYNYEVNLLVHVAIIHSNECTIVNDMDKRETTYKCAICNCLFSRKKAHQAHCLIHQVDEELPCEHCPLLFKCRLLLDRHLNEHKLGNSCLDGKLPTNYLRCKMCHQIFNNVGNIKKHYIQFHPKIQAQWSEDILPEKGEETVPTDLADKTLEPQSNTQDNKKRKSSKIACQTIKLYAQGKSSSLSNKHQPSVKSETTKSVNKRGRPKKSSTTATDSNRSSRSSNSNCGVCNKSFKTPILLRRHEVTHTGVKEFECPICKKGFTQKSSVKIHMAVHDNVKGFSCPFCFKSFTYEHNMNAHIRVIHKNANNHNHRGEVVSDPSTIRIEPVFKDNTEFGTQNSEISLTNKDDHNSTGGVDIVSDDAEIYQYLWNDTSQIETQSGPVDSICYQPNQPNSNDDIYVPSTPNVVDWECKSQQITQTRGILLSEDVERIDKETGQLQVHEMIKDQITGYRRFRCRFCYKLYRKSCDLSRHTRIHTQQKPFACYMCHKAFRLKSVLKNHFKSHWKLKEYSCNQCHKIFNLKQTLKVHQQLHNPNQLRYSCQLCHKRFNTAFHYKYHARTAHKNEPAPVINGLDGGMGPVDSKSLDPVKTFMWNEILNQPVAIPDSRSHHRSDQLATDSNQLFKCNHCGRSYKFKKYLNEHLKDHMSANRTNICHFCNKSFLTFRSMQQHLRTQHINRRKFLCSQCPAFFITKASLSRHGLVHSNSKPFVCPLCFRRFKAKIYCDRHINARKCSTKRSSKTWTGINQQTSACTIDSGANDNVTVLNIQHNNDPNIHTDVISNHHHNHQINNGTGDQSEVFSTFRLEDLDMATSQSSNILVTNYVNEFSSFPSSEKYMIVSLDNQSGKELGVNSSSSHQHDYYASNLLIDNSSANNVNDHVSDQSGNIMGLLEGQMGVTPIDISSLFAVQNYPGNMASLVERDAVNSSQDLDYQQHQDNGIYYYQTIGDIPQECHESPPKGSLADKFPILKASLFSEDECTYPKPMATTDQTQLISAPIKFYHGCANCDQQFKDSQSLVHHVKTNHKIRKDFPCNVCHKAFSAKLSLWAHSKTHIDSRSFGCFVCIACNQRFISVPSLSRHVRMQHNDNLNLYRCTHCNKVYKTTRELDSHVKQLISEYDALIINSSLIENTADANEVILTGLYPRTKPAEQHDVDIDKMYFAGLDSCQIDQIASMDVASASKMSFKELIKVAKETKGLAKSTAKPCRDTNQSMIDPLLTYPYSCSICHKGFNRASNLQQHLSVHTKLKPYQCSKCNNRFRHRCSLKTHEATKHSPITKLLRCHLCSKLLRSQVALRNHMKIHVRNYLFRCELCHKGFQSSTEFVKHLKQKHDRQKKETTMSTTNGDDDTNHCKNDNESNDKAAIDLDQLKQEIVPEIPKKLIKCLSCSFIFNTRFKYNNHYCVSSHSLKSSEQSQQPNTCCDKTFESTFQLLSHMQKVHQQIIQYSCAQCNIMFAQESSFINHQKSVHHLL